MFDFTYIETHDTLDKCCKEIQNFQEIAIDLECENNLHHFGTYISLIQISTPKNHWIIDVLELAKINPLLTILENSSIQKVFHDVNFDLRILQHQFHCRFKNIFDTQFAAEFLGKDKIGLGSLLEEYFGIRKEQKFQKVDWTKRPLSKEMLAYAIKDTAYLLELKQMLCNELKKIGRLSWVEEECQHLGNLDWTYKEQSYLDVSGVRSLSPKERAIFHALFDARRK